MTVWADLKDSRAKQRTWANLKDKNFLTHMNIWQLHIICLKLLSHLNIDRTENYGSLRGCGTATEHRSEAISETQMLVFVWLKRCIAVRRVNKDASIANFSSSAFYFDPEVQ